MLNEDSKNLLCECDAGVKMAIASIEEVVDNTETTKLHEILSNSLDTHKLIKGKIDRILNENDIQGKEVNPMAKTMSWMKTNIKMMTDDKDATIADLMADGCNMGVKSISKFINEYSDSTQEIKDIAMNIRDVEEELEISVREYL